MEKKIDVCPHCGSKHVKYEETVETMSKKEIIYKCLNCKQNISNICEKKQASGTLLARFTGTAAAKTKYFYWKKKDHVAKLWRTESGELLCELDYSCKEGKYGSTYARNWVTSTVPKIYLCDQTLFYERCLECNGSEEYAEPFVMDISSFVLSKDLTELALQTEAMRINYDENKNCFSLIYEKEDVIKWLKQNLLPASKKSSAGCYVATCVYGSYNCPNVRVLRRYRDKVLSNSWYGRTFIKCYYAISPTIVRMFGRKKWFNSICKKPLDYMVYKLQLKGIESTPYED